MEPTPLRRGKAFHKRVQATWTADQIRDGLPTCEKVIRCGRVDVAVDELGDFVSVIEIKSTDWDRIAPKNVTRLLGSHRRQVWKYVHEYIDEKQIDVCPGVIYPRPPRRAGLRDQIEQYLNDAGIQVVWMPQRP